MIKMNTKIILPIAVVLAVIATAGIMFAIGFDQQPDVTTNTRKVSHSLPAPLSGRSRGR
jgi:flagellar basal body-associated protein FliL